jgi:hypothetical protein
MSEVISQIFGLKTAKTATLGATLIDTDPSAGYTIKGNAMSQVRSPTQVVSCPKDALAIYPALEVSEQEAKKGSPVITMAPMWVNGFIPYTRSLIDPRTAAKETAAIMAKFGLVSTDMNFNSRSDEQLNTLFTFFKWYGGKDDEDRIIPSESADDTNIGKNIRMGLTCTKWSVKPLSVRYVVKQRGNEKSRDYLYLVGGSDEMLMDNPDKLAPMIGQMFRDVLANMESGKNVAIPNGGQARTITSNADLSDPHRVWWELDDGISDELLAHPFSKAYLGMKRINRTIQGIVYIRNYFVYAKKHLGIEKVAEFNRAVGVEPKEISIASVINRYENIYQYVKNVCHLYPEVASGKLDI